VRLGFAVKVLGEGGLPSHDARRWQSGPHLRHSLEALRAVLGYLARYNEAQAMPLVEEVVAGPGRGQDSSFLLELTRSVYPAGLDALLGRKLGGEDPGEASSAAYVMSQRGPEQGRGLIEARLARWRKEWVGRAGELDADGAGEQAVLQRMVEVNLVEALLLGKSWKMSEAEAQKLGRGCVTEACRQRFPK